MNKPSKCKNCQWYGKPYWSIINPCDNCPMENIETFTVWQDPTIKEKDKEIERLKERIEYLERSNNRREDEILELRKENADLDNIINELEKWLNKKYDEIDKKRIGSNLQEELQICSYLAIYETILKKLQELKGDGSNE